MLTKKIKNLQELRRITAKLRSKGHKVVFTNGCFDILHYGHVALLDDSKNKGDVLIVGINSDASARAIKGPGRPLNNQLDRAMVLAALTCVDYVTIFNERTPERVINVLRPDVLVKGGDWKPKDIVGSIFVRSYGGKVARIPIRKGRSTTTLIKKIRNRY
ncbi:MAG: D-glycero-beta-D-manno-heptose 1-phosphate adenylyltransferase [Candidatus Omnitrophota bacterium]